VAVSPQIRNWGRDERVHASNQRMESTLKMRNSLIPSHLVPNFDPKSKPGAVVVVPNLRVTVLTQRLLRIEYSPSNQFEDRPSQPFWFRNQPVPEFDYQTKSIKGVKENREILEITTPDLVFKFTLGTVPTPETLSIRIKSMGSTWHFKDENVGNLKGTYRTLDNRDGKVTLEQGLLSIDGWALIDDSNTLVFNDNGWLVNREAHPDTFDYYFFGYGHDYQDCIRDYRILTGPVPLLPRWVLGNWWSRYWAYNQDQIVNLIQEFRGHEVPLSVFIIDMDWHITETGNESSGWTGYTWNKELFPDPQNLIRQIHGFGLKTALNLHPADGIYPHEKLYPEFAKYMGIDPDSEKNIPFDLADPKFSEAYFDLLHHPQEALGVDFWWIDWQQGAKSSLPGLDPLWWLNHLHFFDLSRPISEGSGVPRKRPFIFSRWGGLGNHRYPIGFSGDTVITWDSLAYQPYFTATAANVCYGWWSHDIGGHMSGIEDPELYTRWVQYGVLSPIFRLHSTNNPFHERRPYAYDAETKQLTSYAMRLRHSMIPYLYTMSWRDHKDATAPIRPLYHIEPESEPAYHSHDTYTFGSELIAAPHTNPLNFETRLSRKKIWLPKGDWYDTSIGEHFLGGHHVIYGDLEQIPLFAKSGAIVPLGPLPTWGGTETPNHLSVHVFPGNDNQFQLYEDDGDTTGYQNNAFALTPFLLKWEDDQIEFIIGPADGDLRQCPTTRTYELIFWGIQKPEICELQINQKPHPVETEYDPKTRTLTVHIKPELTPTDRLKVILIKDRGNHIEHNDVLLQTCKRLLKSFRLESYTKLGLSEMLPTIIQNPESLARTRPRLTDNQLLALLEIITRSGIHQDKHSGIETIQLWNESPIQDTFPVTYQLSVNQLDRGFYDHPHHYESGPLPKFKVFHPPTHFMDNPWELRVHYGNVLTITFSSDS